MNKSKEVRNAVAVLLAVVLVNGLASAAVITSGVITVGSGDLLAGQNDPTSGNTNFNFRYSYGAVDDTYCQNGNYTTADQTGWATAANWYTNMQRMDMSGSGGWVLTALTSSTVEAIQWTFNFANTGQTIEKLVVRIPHTIFTSGQTAALYINVGAGDQQYESASPSGYAQYNNYYDLTSYAQGKTSFTIREVGWPTWFGYIQSFTGSAASAYSLDVQVTVPEPMSLALLGIGGMAALLPRRRSRKDVD